jgi:membrane-bound lytic murein transglycosylase B
LFALRGSSAISFGRAIELANGASRLTGVRPALILGVIQQETRLGEFLGNGNWRTDMHPTRDQPVFQQIMAELGLDPDSVPISAAPSYGYGGAMGPAQFIPSTWILYKDRIAQVTGHNPPNPYDPFDAFTASALLLADNGADRGTREAERLAALRYFAGWANAEKPAYAFYGNEVMALADNFQRQIDVLAQSR